MFTKSTLEICRNDKSDEDVYNCVASSGTTNDVISFYFMPITKQGIMYSKKAMLVDSITYLLS